MTNARYRHQAVVLQDWTVLIMGGQGADGTGLSSVESLSLSTGNVSTKVCTENVSLKTSLTSTFAWASLNDINGRDMHLFAASHIGKQF